MQWCDDILFSEQQLGARLLQERRRWNRAMLSGGAGVRPKPCKPYRKGSDGHGPRRRLHRYQNKDEVGNKFVLWGNKETNVEDNSFVSGMYIEDNIINPKNMNEKCDFRVGRIWSGKCSDGTRKNQKDCKAANRTWKGIKTDAFTKYKNIVKLLKVPTIEGDKALKAHKAQMKKGELIFDSKNPSNSDYAVGSCCFLGPAPTTNKVEEYFKKEKEKKEEKKKKRKEEKEKKEEKKKKRKEEKEKEKKEERQEKRRKEKKEESIIL